MRRTIRILGSRGIPAEHGGFETFAECLALHLVSMQWDVTVYCQEEGRGPIVEDEWRGVRLVHVPVSQEGPLGTIVFDWKSSLHAARKQGLILTLGYNTALFCSLYRIKGVSNIINMDGIEWRRGKWTFSQRAWLYVNERLGCWFANHLIADHPEIKARLGSWVSENKITTIPYGAYAIEQADSSLLELLGLQPGSYVLVVARPEPENSILEIIRAYSRKHRGIPLVILGNYTSDENSFHRRVICTASEEILFPGAIYDKSRVAALRFYARLYIHGHTVGGTNPSLVEALGAGLPVLAHDNKFNRWVIGPGGHYFSTEEDCAAELDSLLADERELACMRVMSQARYHEAFSWDRILKSYEELLLRFSSLSLEPGPTHAQRTCSNQHDSGYRSHVRKKT